MHTHTHTDKRGGGANQPSHGPPFCLLACSLVLFRVESGSRAAGAGVCVGSREEKNGEKTGRERTSQPPLPPPFPNPAALAFPPTPRPLPQSQFLVFVSDLAPSLFLAFYSFITGPPLDCMHSPTAPAAPPVHEGHAGEQGGRRDKRVGPYINHTESTDTHRHQHAAAPPANVDDGKEERGRLALLCFAWLSFGLVPAAAVLLLGERVEQGACCVLCVGGCFGGVGVREGGGLKAG